ncbi:MAG: hypothetical protein R6U78_11270 [Bacteroidales bacterium]
MDKNMPGKTRLYQLKYFMPALLRQTHAMKRMKPLTLLLLVAL